MQLAQVVRWGLGLRGTRCTEELLQITLITEDLGAARKLLLLLNRWQ